MVARNKNQHEKVLSYVERISPVTIDPSPTAITVGISKRFLLFEAARWLMRRVEEDPRLTFLSALKRYKAFGKLLHGSVRQLYRDRNHAYVKNFFSEMSLYEAVRDDIEWMHERNPDVSLTITKRGILIYDSYRKNSFNVLLITPHAGRWIPAVLLEKQVLNSQERAREEDIATHRIYGDIFLSKGGIWIDNKLSRFACDYNRDEERAIYEDKSEPWIPEKMWKSPLTPAERKWLLEGYHEFYVTLQNLIDSYRFNIIFDGHSMKDGDGRPEISFGVEFIPTFYMPVVWSMRRKLQTMGYQEVEFNTPYKGGNIIRWMHNRFPDVFVFSIEVNKKLYMTDNEEVADRHKVEVLAQSLRSLFDFEREI